MHEYSDLNNPTLVRNYLNHKNTDIRGFGVLGFWGFGFRVWVQGLG